MATIYTRAAKGSALTWTEGDANITNLNNAKIEAVADDTTPQLGGNLDVAGNSIVSTANGNITIAPDGTGRIVLDGQTWPATAPATNGEYLTATAAGDISWTDRVNAKTIYETVKNVSGGSLAKGTPVYQVGMAGNTVTVAAARADDPAKLAIGVLDETVANDAEGRMLVLGEIKGVDTSAFAVGDKVYLAATGGYTNTAPTTSGVAVQFLGVVFRVDANNGSGYITGTLTEDMVRYTGSAFEGWNGTAWVALGGGISALVDDTTPQLGGDLDVQTYKITNQTYSGNIVLEVPNGYGYVQIANFTGLDVQNGITNTATNGNLSLSTNGTGRIILNGNQFPTAYTTTAGYVLTNNGSGDLSWAAPPTGLQNISEDTTPQLGGDLDIRNFDIISSETDADIKLTPNGSGKVWLGTLKFPNSPGSSGQVLTTDGIDTLSWTSASGGIAALVDDTTPQLGGNLDVNGNSIVSVSNGNIAITPDGTGNLVLDGLNWPQADGSADQVLKTNGSGQLSWTTISATYPQITDDTSTNATRYIVFENVTSGDASGVGVSSTKLTFNPSTGRLSATEVTGSFRAYNEGAIYDLGTTGGTISPDVANGNVQKITLNSALTLNAFTNPVAGQSLTLIIYGGTAYTSITSTMKFAGGVKTLTATAGCIDILSIYYDGTTYFASLNKGFA